MSSSSRPLSSFESKLNQMIEFNPGLVYALNPEYSVSELNMADLIQHASEQFKDILDAYIYAQNTVLPLFKTKSFTPDEFIYHLKQIHMRIAKAVEKDANRDFAFSGNYAEKAGEYYLENIIHFQQGIGFGENLQYYTRNLMSLDMLITKGVALGLTSSEVTGFVRIFRAANYDMDVLAQQVYSKTLSEEEQIAVARIVKFGTHRKNIPQKMWAFAAEFIKQFQAVNSDQKEEVVEWSFFLISQILAIHPFFNVNKRATVCMLNTCLRALNLPSIVLCYPTHTPTEHDFTKAIEHIDTQPHLLRALLLHRLNHPEFTDTIQREAIVQQVAMMDAYTQLQNEQKDKSAATYFASILKASAESETVAAQMKAHKHNPLIKNPDYAKLLSLPLTAQLVIPKLQSECKRIREAKIRQKIQTEIESYLMANGLTKVFKALLNAIEEKQYSRALRTVCNSTANETHLLKIVSILTKYSAFISIDKDEKAGKQALSAVDYASQRQHTNVLAYMRKHLKTPAALNAAATTIQHAYRIHKLQARFFKQKEEHLSAIATSADMSTSSQQTPSLR